MSTKDYSIGALGRMTGFSADTLRYYEKIGLLQDIPRHSGQRRYAQKHLEQLQFIRSAQSMDFSLAEIAQLLQFRVDPISSRGEVRALAEDKLKAINRRIKTLQKLQKELKTLVDDCHHGEPGVCPIITGLEK